MSIVYLFPYLIQEIVTILYFPVWWYTKGARQLFRSVTRMSTYGAQVLALGIWIKNWGTPMFGQDDWQGRIISFFMRTVQIVIRSLLLVIWVLCMLTLFLVYITLPILAFVQLIIAIWS